MKKLSDEDVKELHAYFGDMTAADVEEIAGIFYSLKEKSDYRLRNTGLDSVGEYVEEYCNSWYRYKTFEELVISEKDQGAYGFTEEECRKQIGESIFELESGWFIQCVY